MDLRIPASSDLSGKRGPVARAASDDKAKAPKAPESEAPERDPIADSLVVDPDLLSKVQAALAGKADMPKELADKSGEPTASLRFLPQDDVLPDREEILPKQEVGADLSGTRFKTMEDPSEFRPPVADKDGNYIFSLGDPRQGAVNAYVSAYKALQIAEKYLGREVKWGFEREADRERLWIHPHAGEGMNAFYNNKNGSINFLYAEDPRTKDLIDTSTSLEVVSHETGHAILDGLRPKYVDSLDTSSAGFHEAFGDCIAMLSSLSDDDVVEALYQETRGNLAKPNIVSRMGEQLGRAMRGPKNEFVRSSLNDHVYRDPHFLPFMAFPEGPAIEPHSNSQVWSGATYDLLRLLVHDETEDSQKPFVEAVRSARDTLGQLLMRSVEFAPLGKITYRDAAISMLKADMVDNKASHLKELLAVFTSRNILSGDDAEQFMMEVATTKLMSKAISLPDKFDPKDAKAFLADNAEVLDLSPEDLKDLKFDKMVTNDRGEKILQYGSEKRFELSEPAWGAQYQGSSFKLHGGLLLAFDKDNKLIVVTRDPITDDNVDDAKLFLRKMIDFQKNPPIIVKGGGAGEDEDVKGKDPHLDYMLASTRQPVEVVNGEVRRTGILYCGD
jgi:hypothetical protein